MAQYNQHRMAFDVQMYQEYRFTASGTATTAFPLVFAEPAVLQQVVIVECRTQNAIVNFGNSSVAASATLTNNALPAGNISYTAGAIVQSIINAQNQNYVSLISDGTTGATVIIRLGYFNL